MSLSPGTRLGPYEVLAPAGAGGMGEVYRARDTRLNRDVAVKVLPEAFAASPDRLARFEQEARAVAALSHPNILNIYDVGSHNGLHYLVCELLEGESLRDRLAAEPLPPRRATELAAQVAHGLAAAHDKGIIHRDLKPENIFFTRDQRAKILDFGLAKTQTTAAAAGLDVTQTTPVRTDPGIVMGTVGYMAPEQVRGGEATHCSDIFSFGAVLYEMLTGQRAFKRDSAPETMAAILREDPPEISASGAHVSPGLERIVGRCLEKAPERRFQSASDLAFALEALTGSTGAVVAPAPHRARWRWLAAAAAAVFAIAFLAYLAGLRMQSHSSPNYRQLTFRNGYIRMARFAPDGQSLVFGALWDGTSMQLQMGRIDSQVAQTIEPRNADVLAVSSTGEVAVALDRRFPVPWTPSGTLARIPLIGGPPRRLLEGVTDADFTPDGSGLAFTRQLGTSFRLEYPAGKVLFQTTGFVSHMRFSPKGDLIAFIDHPIYGDDRGYVAMVDLTGKHRRLIPEFTTVQGLAWRPDGEEIWFTGSPGAMNAAIRAVSLSGKQRVVLQTMNRLNLQDIAGDGKVLFTTERIGGDVVAVVNGKASGNLSSFQWSGAVGMSEDARLIAMSEFNSGDGLDYAIYVRQTDGSPAIMLGRGFTHALSPDGRFVLASTVGPDEKLVLFATQIGQPRELPVRGFSFKDGKYFPDSRNVLLIASQGNAPARTYMYDTEGTAEPRPITPDGVFGNVVSPDGRELITVNGNGEHNIYPVAGGEPRPARGIEREDVPVQWLNDGSVLVHRHADKPGAVYRVNINTGARTLWKRIEPRDRIGMLSIRGVWVTRDGRQYAYETRKLFSDLFVMTGLK